MAYTFTIDNSSKQALAIIEYLKTLSFVKFTETVPKEKAPTKAKAKTELKKPTFSQEVLEAAEELKWTPDEIVEAAKKEKMSPEDYAFTMLLSKKINHNIAKHWDKHFNL